MNSPPQKPALFEPGTLLAGKYRVERLLGEGGMGVVVSAVNEMLQQRVALKLLRPGALGDQEALARFLREARAAAKLRSEHVARVLDTGSLEDGRPYMVLEYLEGRDLGDLIEHGPAPSIAEAVDYVLQVCEAIAEAHGAGIVHRDLKPRNLFLTRTVDGRPLVKVLDFGISKLDDGQESMQLTRTTEVIGSPSYMSPEQLRSARYVDQRTDIWALGVILYELLSGRLPFYANTVTELVAVVLMEREPPLHLLRAEVPPALSGVIARCLAKLPTQRYQTVLELVHDLEPFASRGAATAADRVRGVALVASRGTVPLPLPSSASGGYPLVALPSAPASAPGSAGPAAATAWADTKREGVRTPPPPAMMPAPARGPLFGVAITLGVLGVAAAGGGAVWVAKRPPPPAAAEAPLPPVPLPPGRKDLPPLPSSSTFPVVEAAPPSSAAGSSAPVASAPVASARPSAPATVRGRPASGAAPTRPSGNGDNPLDDIGRR